MRKDAEKIMERALRSAMPGEAVKEALKKAELSGGELVLVAAGKAAWEMAKAAVESLGSRISRGVVITKYGHVKGALGTLEMIEAGHPVPDENSCLGASRALELVQGLSAEDHVLFLLSGGGSALFEKPLVPLAELAEITGQLLSGGADIVEMNTIRKRLSAVKGGRFALACAPARVSAVVLSDIIGDPLDMIASGPVCADSSTCEEAQAIVSRLGLKLSPQAAALMKEETPKKLENVETFITGSVRQLCVSAAEAAKELGYEPVFLTASLSCEAREAGRFLGCIARDHQKDGKALAFLAGGETVVHLTGKGKGGRNQEIALAAAAEIRGLQDTCIFSFGSDGTDGPTDAAGGYADGETAEKLRLAGFEIPQVLQENNAYPALAAADGLIITGPTGTNVNDLSVLLIRRQETGGKRVSD